MKGIVVAAAVASALFSGCAMQPRYQADQYSTGLTQQQVQLGRVIAVTPVEGLGGTQAGQLLGGVAGAATGSAIGSGSGRYLSVALGGLIGAVAGGYAQQHLTSQQALQVTVQLDQGGTIGVVETGYQLSPGQRVQVITTYPQGGWYDGARTTTRVVPY